MTDETTERKPRNYWKKRALFLQDERERNEREISHLQEKVRVRDVSLTGALEANRRLLGEVRDLRKSQETLTLALRANSILTHLYLSGLEQERKDLINAEEAINSRVSTPSSGGARRDFRSRPGEGSDQEGR